MSVARALSLSLVAVIVATAANGVSKGLLPDDVPFNHYNHVAKAWMDSSVPEVARDCRGCHDPEKPSAGLDLTCTKCHFGAQFAPRGSFEIPYTPGAFEHGDHTGMSCRECHAPEAFRERQPARYLTRGRPIPIRRGFAECSRCHGGEPDYAEPAGFVDPGLRPGLLQEQLDESPAMGPDSLGPFEHLEHMTDPGLATSMDALLAAAPSDRNCTLCHDSIRAPREQATVYEESSCGTCHVTRDERVPVRMQPAGAPASLTLDTFFHEQHAQLFAGARPTPPRAGDAAYESLAERACAACHEHRKDEPGFVSGEQVDYAFAAELPSFEGCVVCHTTDHLAPERHEDWGPTGRASLPQGSQECTACHTFGLPPDAFAQSFPEVPIARRRPVNFTVRTQAHPMIGDGAQAPQSCAPCHRAPVTELPSRIQEKRFNHATHLPRDFTGADCVACHANVSPTSGPAEIGAGDAERAGLTYEPGACEKCHLGSAPVPSFGAEESATAVLFSHESHQGAQHSVYGQLDCATCHEPVEDPSARFFAIKACNACHDHATQAAITGRTDSRSTQTCVRCHTREIPAVDRAIPAGAREHIAGSVGVQHHPPDRACAECHLDFEQPEFLAAVSQITAAAETVGQQTHKRRPYGKFDELQDECFLCHWSGLQGSGTMTRDPEDPQTRARLGALLANYPGVPE